MKKTFLGVMIFILVLASSCAAETQKEARGFNTPAECAQAVFEALQKDDVSAVEACFAIPEMARLFDYRKFCERLNSVISSYPYLPSTTELGIAYNEASLRLSLYRRILFSSYLLADDQYGETVNDSQNYPLRDEGAYELISFLETPSSVTGFDLLTLDEIVTPDTFEKYSELYTSERNVDNRALQMSMWLVEDDQELVLVLSASESLLNGDKLIMPLRLVQINGKWLADPTGSNFGSMLGVRVYNFFVLQSTIR